ncbi:MAG: lamin tail domain-containing protein, partial [Verrucomicrobiota bacterium]
MRSFSKIFFSFLVSGWLILAGSISAKGAAMSPVSVSGWNRDVVIENTIPGAPYNSAAVELNPGEGNSFYQSGLAGKSFGLPVTRSFTSVLDSTTGFQFQPYTANNALLLSSATGLDSGTLTLATPGVFGRIAILANSASGGGSSAIVFSFSDGTSFSTSYDAPDWFNNAGFALQGTERIKLADGSTQGAPANPRFYQTTIDLAGAGYGGKTLSSITFDKVPSAGATAVYAVSGEAAAASPAAITSGPPDVATNESSEVNFVATVSGQPAPGLQWFRNSAVIPGATSSSYNIPSVMLSDNGSTFYLVASNVVNGTNFTVTSRVAMLNVSADTNPPVLLGAASRGLSQVLARFSERIRPATATILSNYSLLGTNGNIPISSAALDAGQSNVVLTTAALVEGAAYTLSITNLSDQSFAANVMTNSSAAFIASRYTSAQVGNPVPAGSAVVVSNGLDISSGGKIGGAGDQFQFSYMQQTGDFDFRVRIGSFTGPDAWSAAGLVVRDSLATGARFASAMATPSISGCFFQSRITTNGAASTSGSFPANYPDTWLRLKRTGNLFTGFAGLDGNNWTQLGSVTIAMAPDVYLGFGVASADSNRSATAAFRDFSPVTNPEVSAPLTSERLGQSSRRTSLIISEVMYHPLDSGLEFIELFNTRGEPQDISGFKVGGDVNFTFPPGTSLPGGAFAVIAKSPTLLQSVYGISGVYGPYSNSLPNRGGTVKLSNGAGAVFLETAYGDSAPWPVEADGGGHSLVLARPSYGEDNPLAWSASSLIGGSPGKLDPAPIDPRRNVVINEFLAHTDLPEVDYIELYNHSTQAVDVSGCIITDNATTNKFVIAPGTVIPARGFLAFTESTLNFALNAAGETIFFKNAEQTRILDAVKFGAQENGVATGRYPDGGDEFYRLSASTPGGTNTAIRSAEIVINELMYHPISGNDDEQFVELHNRGASAVNLGGWRLEGGVSFTFPSQSSIPADGYVVVGRNVTQLLSKYPALRPTNTFGNFSGKLSGRGERVALTMPDLIASTDTNGVTTTNVIHIAVDEVTYGSGGRWPRWADGGGSSLELTDARGNRRLPSSWADSDETQKAPWAQISATGTID